MQSIDAVQAELDRLKLEKVRRMEEERLLYYNPHAGQLLLHQSQAPTRAAVTGNQWGKSYWGCVEMLWSIGKVHPYRKNYVGRVYGRDCGVDFGQMLGTTVEHYRTLTPRRPQRINGYWWPGLLDNDFNKALEWNQENKKLWFADGSFIEFMSYAQERDRYRGPARHVIRHDEEPPYEIYTENIARQSTTGENMLFTLTPQNYSEWLYAELHERSIADPSKVFVVSGSVHENPWVDKEYVASLEERYTDPAERAARLHGAWTVLEGRVLKEYGDHNLYDPFKIPHHWYKTILIDPHDEKPTAVNWFATDGVYHYTYREADLRGDVEEVSRQIRGASGGEMINDILIDPSALRKSTLRGKSIPLVDEFREHLNCDVNLANNDVDLGISSLRAMVKKRMNGPILKVSRLCPVSHKQLLNWSWQAPLKTGEERRKPRVVKRNDDHCDNHKYYSLSAPVEIGGESFDGFNTNPYAN